MQNIFDKCPACGGQLIITECQCSQCKLQMRGEFRPGRFLNFSDDQLTFIQVFLSARGNLSEVERILGVSYPTARLRVEEMFRQLKGEPEPQDPREILTRLKAGEIDVSEAERLLRGDD